ncbi:MAG: class I SAM-dependent methyltransferase [Propionibacteriales bacterium]|nr:class I SAM-dependent methyltransferase [Propionibacteriales bacterium]
MDVSESPAASQPGSSSIQQPDYWWYRARTGLLQAALGGYLGEPSRVLDVGSADGPSVDWMRGDHQRFAIDVDPRGLKPGRDTCASALALPFPDDTFDVVGAFDVLEHCEPESVAIRELTRVLAPGGRLLMSVPAYQWAWSDHDVRAGHYRRYTRARLLDAVHRTGLTVLRSTYAFGGVFPFFVAERVARRLRPSTGGSAQRLPQVSPAMDRVLMGLTRGEQRLLGSRDIPFGSSVLVAAAKPGRGDGDRRPGSTGGNT